MVSTDLLMNDKITPIEFDGFRFLIMDCPTNDNIHLYLKVWPLLPSRLVSLPLLISFEPRPGLRKVDLT